MSGTLEPWPGNIPTRRRAVREELARARIAAQLAMTKIDAHREVATYGAASATRLRDILREIEQYNPDAAPEAAVFVRIAISNMIAAQLEFGAVI